MIYNEDTYYVGYHRNVRVMGGYCALVFDTICGMIVNGDSTISNSSIAELLSVEERSVQKYVSKLITLGYVDKAAGNGRGKKTTYCLTEKGEQNAPLYNKDNKRVFIRTSACANDEEKKEKINLNMKDFNLFWDAFHVDEDHQLERERCERMWSVMNSETQDAILAELERGKKSIITKSPRVYLYNYKTPLPFLRQGTAAFGRWIDEHEHKDKIVLMRYDGSLAYVLLKDMPKMIDAGAEFIRNFNFKE